MYNWEKSKAYIYEAAVPDETLYNTNASLKSLRISEKKLFFVNFTKSK